VSPGDEPVVIEVRINEMAVRADNPNVPYGARDVVEEACRAWEAGASVLHWHGRDPVSGDPDNSFETYAAVAEGVRARTDMLLHPTLGYTSQQDPVERTRHVVAAQRDPALRPDMVPVDFGSLNVDSWDPQAKQFGSYDQLYANSRARIRDTLEILAAADVFVCSLCWDIGQIRTARAFQEMGLHSRRTLWELFFTGDTMPVGTPATIPALQAMLQELPPGEPWTVVNWQGNVLPVAAWAITLGGHVSVGLGDWPHRELGAPAHGELVTRVADMARTLGRRPATAAETRHLLGLRAWPGAPAAGAGAAAHRSATPQSQGATPPAGRGG
jgi:uncharacterized protein (DUF849 family)